MYLQHMTVTTVQDVQILICKMYVYGLGKVQFSTEREVVQQLSKGVIQCLDNTNIYRLKAV
jgi:hypothetical protein